MWTWHPTGDVGVRSVMLLVLASSIMGCGGRSSPISPSPMPVVETKPRQIVSLDVRFERGHPSPPNYPFQSYGVCGTMTNSSGQNVILWFELKVFGADGIEYQVEELYDDLVPKKYPTVATKIGCVAIAADYKYLTHAPATSGRLIVHYEFDDGSKGTEEYTSEFVPEREPTLPTPATTTSTSPLTNARDRYRHDSRPRHRGPR